MLGEQMVVAVKKALLSWAVETGQLVAMQGHSFSSVKMTGRSAALTTWRITCSHR